MLLKRGSHDNILILEFGVEQYARIWSPVESGLGKIERLIRQWSLWGIFWTTLTNPKGGW